MADKPVFTTRHATTLPERIAPLDDFHGCRQLEASMVAIRARGILSPPPFSALLTHTTGVPASASSAPSFSVPPSKPQTTPGYLIPRALAKRWSVCIDKVLGFIKAGELRAFNVASSTSTRPRYRISIEEVRRFEEQTRSAASPRAAESKTARRRKPSATTPPARAYF